MTTKLRKTFQYMRDGADDRDDNVKDVDIPDDLDDEGKVTDCPCTR